MKYFFGLIIVFTSTLSWAQEKKIYYDQDQMRTSEAHAKYFVLITKDDGKYKMTGFTMNGHKSFMLGWCTTPDSESRNGFFTFYENGYKSSEGSFENNVKSGTWNNFYPESTDMWYTEQYRDRMLVEIISYYKDVKTKRYEVHSEQGVTGKCYDERGQEIPFTPFWRVPAPPYDVSSYLTGELHYPEKAKQSLISGVIPVKFHVTADGSIKDISVLKHLGGGCDAEAIRVIAHMPKWTPGTKDGQAIDMPFVVPITFQFK